MKKRKNKEWVKTNEEIKLMQKAGKICAEALKEVLAQVDVGVSCQMLDKIARSEIEKRMATSSFMTVDDYAWTICTTINDQVVHGIPTDRKLESGDIIGIDIGACVQGYHSDQAITVPVGLVDKSKEVFLKTGRVALEKAIASAQVGNKIGDISATIQAEIEGGGYQVVKSLTGHGIGKQLHEEPLVPGYGKPNTGPEILENMVLAIEVIYAQKSADVKLEEDGWTISTHDGSLGGLFEQTVASSKSGPIVLTPYLNF